MLEGKHFIPPACFSFADGISFSASLNGDLGVNSCAPPPLVTTFSSQRMQNALHNLTLRDYGTNSSFPRDPFSRRAPNPSFHQQSVCSGSLEGPAGVVAPLPGTTDHMVQPWRFSPFLQYPVLCYPGDNIFLPRCEFPKFSGDLVKFTICKNEFVKYIVGLPKVSNHKMLLCYFAATM